MRKVLLVGCGAEIGSLLVTMVDPARDGFQIGAILTRPIKADPKYPELSSIDSLVARIVLADPRMLGQVTVARAPDRLVIRGIEIPVHWGDVLSLGSLATGQRFDACVLATSKTHINDKTVMESLLSVAEVVVGVAEAEGLWALYPSLDGAPAALLLRPPEPIGDRRLFCLGSCQTNGWQAIWHGLLAALDRAGVDAVQMRGAEVDIVHPDTPTGRLGTKSLSAREQDPRNNLRPSFSQVALSMRRLLPGTHGLNTVSLRTLTMPPGFQICRFFFEYRREAGRLDRLAMLRGYGAVAERSPTILHLADLPLGSRGFEFCEAAAVVLPQSPLFQFHDDPFGAVGPGGAPLSEMIVQAYVHNTRGYCRSVIEALRGLFSPVPPKIFAP
ncbi:MAG: hypothetical protein HQL41_01270 [Alphaproteobacteria bacterium]|nr:hypothetical protein [Alphaproteobacteria bacterium]